MEESDKTEEPFTVQKLNENLVFKNAKSDNVIRSTVKYVKKYYKPTPNCMKDYILARFPFFLWIFSYDFKENIVKDLMSGITIGVVHIPQGKFSKIKILRFK
jgi:hypothetical protein